MPKIEKCDRCLLNARNAYPVCAIHPVGPKDYDCLDFRASRNIEDFELWEPKGARFIGGQLVVEREPFYYDCSPVTDYLTPEEKLELLDTHPMFTGLCPQCRTPFTNYKTPLVHWDCNQCGWLDDTV